MMKLGTELNTSARREALSRFVRRMTVENRATHPEFASRMDRDGFRMRILTDTEWLAVTRFHVTKNGNLSKRHRFCECNQPITDIQIA